MSHIHSIRVLFPAVTDGAPYTEIKAQCQRKNHIFMRNAEERFPE
jgi:hypothetical protein